MLRRRAPTPPRRPASIALAGAGTMSAVHAMAAAAAGLPVVAVAAPSENLAQERATLLEARACSFDELPAGADAVVVATPPALHASHALAALRSGVTVLVETPLATTLAEADELVAHDTPGTTLLYGESLVLAPVVTRAVAIARRFGRLGFVEARALSPRPDRGGAGGAAWGGGALFDLGVHPLALALLLAGADEPVEVNALLTAGTDPAVDERAEVRLRFASGLSARIEAGWHDQGTLWDLQASSDTGVVRADLLPAIALEHDGEPVAVPDVAVPASLDPKLAELGYVEQMRALGRAVVSGSLPQGVPGAAFGRAVLDVVAGAYASAGSGGPVALPFAGPRDRTPAELWRG